MRGILASLVDRADNLLHNLGWTPRWLCDLNERLITGERE